MKALNVTACVIIIASFVACPENCNICDLDSTAGLIVCADGNCEVGYGNDADGVCTSKYNYADLLK